MRILFIFSIVMFTIGTARAQLFHEDLLYNNEKSFNEIVDETEKYYDKIGRTRGNGYKQFQRWKYWAGRNLDSKGKVRNANEALSQFTKFRQESKNSNRSVVGSYQELGPQAAINTSTWSSALGRVSAIGLDKSNDNHIIVGSPSGGIWKTLDLGASWTPLFDDQSLLDVFSLEISHVDPDTYWAGLNGALMISTNGGINWAPVGGIGGGLFNTIEMHPADPNILFAVEQSAGRIWKSSDGGLNFISVMDHESGMYDLEFHPTNPNIIYASGNGAMYKSTNGGNSFSPISTGPWLGLTTNTMMMAVTPVVPTNIYVLEETGGGFNAVYFSQNEGATWTTLTDNTCGCQNMLGYNQDGGGGQAPRDMDIIVSPIDPNIIHIAGVETWRTTDLGQTWIQTTFWNKPGQSDFIHADIDLLIYDDSRIVAGTDGGIYYSTDEAISWTDITSGLGIRQFYRIGASQTDIDRVSGGSQDNGTGIIVSETWYDWLGADGMETFIDWSNADNVYGTTQFGGLYKSLDGGQTSSSITGPGGSGNWVTPFEQDPIIPTTIYTGRDEVFKSIDQGENWEAISSFGAGAIDELKIAPTDNNYIYAAVDNTMYYSTDGGANWSSSSTTSNVNYIAVNPFDPTRLTVAITGSSTRVLESTNAGASWTDISANLPSAVGIECVVYEQVQGGGLYCGGNPGIYYTADTASPTWEDNSNNLPKVRVTELEIRNQVLYVGTYGRGLWKFEFVCDGSLEGLACNDLDICTSDDVFDANCNCAGTFADSDSDGVCDGLDVCAGGDDSIDGDNDGVPDFCDGCAVGCPDADCDSVCDADDICANGDDTRDMDNDGIPDYCDPCDDIIGTVCNDGDACTINDVYDSDCNCFGTFNDTDGDGVCNANDNCEGFDDNLDVDDDGNPDGCDDCNNLIESPKLFLELKLDNYPEETSWEITDAANTVLFSSNGTYSNVADGTIVNEAFCSISGGCFYLTISDTYGDGMCCGFGNGYYLLTNAIGDTLAFGGEYTSFETTEFCLGCESNGGDADGDLVCADVDCDDNDATIGVNIINTTCDDSDVCTENDIWVTECDCIGTFVDDDNDGVCNASDLCPGGDDNIDIDMDEIPDLCDGCLLAGASINYRFEIDFDGYPYETSWDIKDANGNIMVSSPPYDTYADDDIISVDICIPEGCYDFTIYDSVGDGMCCGDNPFYLFSTIDGDTIAFGTEVNHFEDFETTPFCTEGDLCAALGGDNDGDGICAANDCDDTDASIGGQSSTCDDGDPCTSNDVYDANCTCAGTFIDSDSDGVCDADDICIGFDDNLIGTACNDNDDCTINDSYGTDCLCAGIFADADSDGVCDFNDVCPLGDDTVDIDNNGIPDACDTATCTNVTNSFSVNPLTHSGSGVNEVTLNYVQLNENVSFTISNINQRSNGPQSRRFIELVTVSYIDESGNSQTYGVYSGASVSTATINILEPVQSITVSLQDSDGNFGNTAMSISFSDVTSCEQSCIAGTPCNDGDDCTILDKWDVNCNCSGTFQDSDTDGICDADDQCPGFDDSLIGTSCDDGLVNTINDMWNSNCECEGQIDVGCETMTTVGSIVSSSNGSQDCITFSYGLEQSDVQFTISNIDSRTSGKRSQRYRDLVTVQYRDLTGATITEGTVATNWAFNIEGPLTFLIICIEDSDGLRSAAVQATVSDIVSCESDSPSACFTQGPCNDGNPCTINDQYRSDCNCLGEIMDSDNDGVCDGNDICQGFNDSIDVDSDGIPDACDDCLDVIEQDDNQNIVIDQSAVLTIRSNYIIPQVQNVSFNAGESVEMTAGFKVENGAIFEAFIESCIQ